MTQSVTEFLKWGCKFAGIFIIIQIKGIVHAKITILSTLTRDNFIKCQTCMTFFLLWNIKVDILRNVVLKTFYFIFHRRKKVMQVWYNMRVSKWWQNKFFWVNCPFNNQLIALVLQKHENSKYLAHIAHIFFTKYYVCNNKKVPAKNDFFKLYIFYVFLPSNSSSISLMSLARNISPHCWSSKATYTDRRHAVTPSALFSSSGPYDTKHKHILRMIQSWGILILSHFQAQINSFFVLHCLDPADS